MQKQTSGGDGRLTTYRDVKVLQLFALDRGTKRIAIPHHVGIVYCNVGVPVDVSLVNDSFGIHASRGSSLR